MSSACVAGADPWGMDGNIRSIAATALRCLKRGLIFFVPSFEYNPADILPRQTSLFGSHRPLDDLKKMLLSKYSGKTLTTYEIYKQHTVGKKFILCNYKEVLQELFILQRLLDLHGDLIG